MNNHVNAICKSVHYHICALHHICSSISEDMKDERLRESKLHVIILKTFILACLSFHSFPQTLQHYSPLCSACPHIIWRSQLQHYNPSNPELSPSISPYLYQS